MACCEAFYERTVDCPLPAEWAGVSDDAKIDYVFNMFLSPRMTKLQWDATIGKMPHNEFEAWTDGGCVVMKTTRRYPEDHPELAGQISYVQYSAYQPERTGRRSMTISEYNFRLRKDFPATDWDAATIKSKSLSNMFRHVEASIIGDQVLLSLTVDMPKVPADTSMCGPPCCCLPG